MELRHSFSLKVDDRDARFALKVGGLVAGFAILAVAATVTLTTVLGQGGGGNPPEVTLGVRTGHRLDEAQQAGVEGARRALEVGPDRAGRGGHD